MYNISKSYFYAASRPELLKTPCDPYSPPSLQYSLQSPSSLDNNCTANSSVSPSSFCDILDDCRESHDALLTQVNNEYYDEEFPTFENILINETDFIPFDFDPEINNNLFYDENEFENIDYNESLQNSPEHSYNVNRNISKNYQIITPNLTLPNENKKIYKIINLAPSLTEEKSNHFEDFSTISNCYKKRKSTNIEFDFIKKKSKNDCLDVLFNEDSKKIGNREAAHRYRQKMKMKVNKGETDLEEAVREMIGAKRKMLEMRREVNTVKGLVSDVMRQHLLSLSKSC